MKSRSKLLAVFCVVYHQTLTGRQRVLSEVRRTAVGHIEIASLAASNVVRQVGAFERNGSRRLRELLTILLKRSAIDTLVTSNTAGKLAQSQLRVSSCGRQFPHNCALSLK